MSGAERVPAAEPPHTARGPAAILLAATVAVLALLALQTGLGLYRLGTTQETIRQLVHNHAFAMQLALGMRAAARERTLLLHRIVDTRDPIDRQELIEQFHEQGERFALARQDLLTLPLDAEERALLDEQNRYTRETAALQLQVVELAHAGRREDAFRQLRDAALPSQEMVLVVLRDFVNHEAGELAQSESEVLGQFQGLRGLLLLAGLATAAIVLAITVFTRRRLQQLITRLTESRQQLDHALQELRDQKFALDHHSIVAITDRTGRIQYANDKFCEISQYSRDELLGQDHRILNSGYHPREFFRQMWATIGRGGVWQGEICNRRKDGSLYWVETSIVPWLGDNGRPERYVSIRTDITARYRMFERLRQSEERFTKAFYAIPDMLMLSRLGDQGFIDVNDNFLRVTGHRREDVIGRPAAVLGVWPDAEAVRTIGERLRRDGEVREFETVLGGCDGRRIPVLLSAECIEMHGEPCVLAIAHDLRRIKQAETELTRARDQALAASQAKSHFLATMTHEFRTPLHGVLGVTRLLADTPLTPAQREYLRMIERCGESLLAQVDGILDFSRVESGRLELEARDFRLREVLQDTVDAVLPSAQRKRLLLAATTAPGTPEALCGDAMRLRQALLNLLGNAVKFTECGEVKLHVTGVGQVGERMLLRFEVCDTGIGIEPAARERIFEAFVQADGSTTRRFGGTGLGLAIVRRLVALMDGEVGVESEPGYGSTFWFTAWFGPAQGPTVDAAGAARQSEPAWLAALRTQLGDALPRFAAVVLDDMPRHLERLRAAAAGGDDAAVVRHALQIRGAAAAMQAGMLSAVASRIEQQARAADRAALPPLLAELEAAWQEIEIPLRALRRDPAALA